jgi:phytoene dehydrogenase-like protein
VADYDAVIVGSGINSLVAGALLARGGWSVALLEGADRLGGAIQTRELTAPGYRHDVLSAWHGEFVRSTAYRELGPELQIRGVKYCTAGLPSASIFADETTVVFSAAAEANVTELERHASGDGARWHERVRSLEPVADLVLAVLETDLRSTAGIALGLRAWRRLGRRQLLRRAGELLTSSRDWLLEDFRSPYSRGLFAPWSLHAGQSPDAAGSAVMTQLILRGQERGGIAVPEGGGERLVEALAGIIRDGGGVCRTGTRVERVLLTRRRACGVRVAGGEVVTAGRSVICNVPPARLYGELLADTALPAGVTQEARRFRFGRAGMQIHMALSEPPVWEADARLGQTAIVHVTDGLDGVSRAVGEAERGLLPAAPTIACGQPLVADPTRAPAGGWILWIQLQELPAQPRGDAGGILDAGDGTWTHALRERFADRVQRRLARHITNLESSLVRRVVLSPADLEAMYPNLVGCYPYS